MNYKIVTSFIYRALAFLLVLAVLLPSGVKLTHAFNHHEHLICNDDIEHTTHFHQTDVECEFYKFKLNENYYQELATLSNEMQIIFNKTDRSYYFFLRTHQQNISYLRGPPSLV